MPAATGHSAKDGDPPPGETRDPAGLEGACGSRAIAVQLALACRRALPRRTVRLQVRFALIYPLLLALPSTASVCLRTALDSRDALTLLVVAP